MLADKAVQCVVCIAMSWFCSVLCLLLALNSVFSTRYEPTWESLDSRPLPGWYDEAKVGIFIHWGVFSVPSFGSEWFWFHWKGVKSQKYIDFMSKNYRPGFTYADFAGQFTAEFYDPDRWAGILSKSGAKYVVLTAKHHEGFTMWPSNRSFNWNANDVGPNIDIVGSLMTSIRGKTNLHYGLYHSLYEWFNPLYLNDIVTGKTDFVDSKTLPELYELVDKYKPEVIWSDGDWDMSPDYWKSKHFLAWLYSDSPVRNSVVVNDRWGRGTAGKHGDFFNHADSYDPGVLQPHKWENCFSLDRESWGYRRHMQLTDVLSIREVLERLVRTVSCGGNVLINIGPTHSGMIAPIFEERLTQLGRWLEVNGEAIYKSKPWIHQNDTLNSNVWYTRRDRSVYAIVLEWPENNILVLGAAPLTTSCEILGLGPVKCINGKVKFPTKANMSNSVWVVKFADAALTPKYSNETLNFPMKHVDYL